jgi:uncharacterized protein YndB with AHSA1/START domain
MNAATTIVIERDIDAPRSLVFEAWTDPKHLVHWYYASEGWTTPFADVDLDVGGKFRIGFASPDGAYDFVFSGTFTEIVPPARLAYTIDDGRAVTLDLTELANNRTHVRLEFGAEGTFPIEQQRDGWGTQVTHLAAYLAAGIDRPPLPEVTFTRVLNAPRDVVFRAWTDMKQLSQWWGPEMFSIPRATLEPRIGGAVFIEMEGPDGELYPVKGRVVDYVENERLVYTGRIIETSAGVFEMEAVTSVIVTDAGPGRTKLVVRARVTKATDKAAFALAGMEEGYRQMLEKFARHIAGRAWHG